MVARSRAQLILAGSVLLAFVIIGLAVVVNTVLFAENVPAGGEIGDIDDAREYEVAARENVRSVVLRINHRNRNVSASGLAGAVEGNVSLYAALLSESYATTRPVSINITYHNGSSDFGTRIVQSDNDVVTDDDGDANWSPVPASQRRKVGWFLVNVDTEATATDRSFLVVSDGAETLNLSLNRSASNDGNLTVTANATYATNRTTTCQASDGRVLLDLLNGSSPTSDCSFPGLEEMGSTYGVRIEDGDNLNASYELVVDENVSSGGAFGNCTSATPRTTPCAAPAVWTANVTTTYASGGVELTTRRNVSIYDDPSLSVLLRLSETVLSNVAVQGDGGPTLDVIGSNPAALGTTGDIDGDGFDEVPYVDGDGNLNVTDRNGERETLVDSSGPSNRDPATGDTHMAVAAWNGQPASVYYANENGNKLWRVESGVGPTRVDTNELDVTISNIDSVVGFGDINGSNGPDLVYVDGSGGPNSIEFVTLGSSPSGNDQLQSTGYTGFDVSAAGDVADVDGDGTAEAIVVDTSNDVTLVDHTGVDSSPASGSVDAEETAPTAADVDTDGDLEVVYVDRSSDELRYVDAIGASPTVETLTDEDGNPVTGTDAGVISSNA
jgi:hypothetical protein